ncbi:demethoxyubiquinone hydroxylase family protein [Croceicoccus sp. BE223]|uniref:demethoxyubiquinone hydroxylase family protein n=1 Tax=Croceicoccus sp. BE223 TaxID=2817716 RepID=UPI002860E1DA|nr:demethoxyubiquinone hydroxylase family protein [Croceicoccus sp. BE223]MDR7102217.1 ubiquinone biosynthesis monooxygenase Coq7 [Croceicoccus sp. BE223]
MTRQQITTGAETIEQMIRVDQAGEYGAARIYAGQIAVMGDRGPGAGQIAAMASQEQEHLDRFNALMVERGVRPTVLQPVWDVAGFALGAATALIGPEAAMACTAAIEEEIDRHYSQQLDQLGESDAELGEMIREFRDDEREHKATALAAGAERAPGYPLLSGAIRLGCRAAIALSKRI